MHFADELRVITDEANRPKPPVSTKVDTSCINCFIEDFLELCQAEARAGKSSFCMMYHEKVEYDDEVWGYPPNRRKQYFMSKSLEGWFQDIEKVEYRGEYNHMRIASSVSSDAIFPYKEIINELHKILSEKGFKEVKIEIVPKPYIYKKNHKSWFEKTITVYGIKVSVCW